MSQTISIQKTEYSKPKPDPENLGFGRYFTDHMFIMDYDIEKGWYDPRIIPYAPLELDPATMILHYGQATFEGLKAYRTKDQRILLFRPDKNIERMNISNERLGIPRVDEAFIVDAIKALVKLESEWIPDKQGTSLYIRPFIIATDPFLGVRPSHTYKFIIILSPVGAYYAEGINPVKIHVESQYVRSVKGGIGYAKTPGNYAASLKAQIEAGQKGFSQVLWLDACEKRYIEEVGSMNVFFKINGEVITPSLDGSILDGITRKSVIQLLQSWDIKVVERKISVDEIYEAGQNGALEEAFGTGTAAVISPVGELNINDQALVINQGKVGEISGKVYQTIVDIQTGQISDPFHWVVEVK